MNKSSPDFLVPARAANYLLDGADVKSAHHRDIRKFGAVPGGTADATSAIQQAIDTGEHAYVPPNMTFRVDGMLEVGSSRCLILGGGASLVRYANAANSAPMIWIKGARAHVSGAGDSSRLITELPCPRGIVRLGYEEPGAQNPPVAIMSNVLRDLRLQGARSMGQPGGAPDVGVWMCNTQDLHLDRPDSNPASYFNRLRHLWFENLNYGIELLAWANANFIQQTGGFGVGNALIFLHGGLDNIIEGTFLTNSPDATTLLFGNYVQHHDEDGSDWTYVPSYNVCSAIAGEQGGASACTVRELPGCTAAGNMIQGMSNTNQGISQVLPDFFVRGNSIAIGDGLFAKRVDSHDRARTDELWHRDRKIVRGDFDTFSNGVGLPFFFLEHHWICDGLVEGNQYKVLTITIPSNVISCGTVKIDGAVVGGNGVQNSVAHGEWSVEKNIVGLAPTITDRDPIAAHRMSCQVTHEETQDILSFIVQVPNNGTGITTKGYLRVSLVGMNLADASVDFKAIGEAI